MQIQPRPETRSKANREGLPWFDCLAVIREDATGTMLKERPSDSWKILFKLTICRTEWLFEVYRVGYCAGQPIDEEAVVRDRLIDRMPVAFALLRPDMMLKPACLMCGKRLSDPISMARWIGPECAGTSSAIIPYNFILQAA
jgi:hypothetical protein